MTWRDLALCRLEDPEVFFPVALEGTAEGDAARAQAVSVCQACPVKAECLTFALDHGETEFGVWGGLTESQRRALSRVGHGDSGRLIICPGPYLTQSQFELVS